MAAAGMPAGRPSAFRAAISPMVVSSAAWARRRKHTKESSRFMSGAVYLEDRVHTPIAPQTAARSAPPGTGRGGLPNTLPLPI